LRMINVELRNRLPELLLMRADKMTMANSVEARVPFLDEDLVQFALGIPSALKFRNGITKYILKKTAERLLPKEVVYRRKLGFCGSATNILTDQLCDYAQDVVLQSPIVAQLFNRSYIEQLFARRRAHRRFNSFKIWNLLNLVLWHDTWFTARREAAAA
jgi:asparagine synthase (glutamine-hydrolysing)